MNKKGYIYLCVLLLIFVGGSALSFWSRDKITEKAYSMVPNEIHSLSRQCADYAVEGKAGELKDMFIEKYRKKDGSINEIRKAIEYISGIEVVKNLSVISYNYWQGSNEARHQLTYQLEGKNKWATYTVGFVEADHGYELFNINFNLMEESLEKSNKFNIFEGKVVGLLVLALMVVNFLFTFITSAICFGSKKEKRKRWAVLILFGIGILHYNWSTGALGFRLLSIGFPTYSFAKASIYSPLLLGLRIPIFAIWYWVKRLREDESTADISEVNLYEEPEEQEII